MAHNLNTTLLSLPSAAQTATGNSGPLQTVDATTLAVDVNVSAATGTTPSMTLNVDRLGADGNWYSVWASSAITTAGVTSASIGPGCAVAAVLTGTVRLRWTITGTTPSFTFSASVVAR